MNIQEILKTGANFTVSIPIADLRQWHKEVIEDTRRELEEVILSGKSETYHSPNQVSEMLGADLTTLWRWAKKGYLVPVEVGGKRKYRMSDIKAILNGGKGKTK